MGHLWHRYFQLGEKNNEHLHDRVRGAITRMDIRIYGIPRGGRADSPSAHFCGNFANIAFRPGHTDRLRRTCWGTVRYENWLRMDEAAQFKTKRRRFPGRNMNKSMLGIFAGICAGVFLYSLLR